MVESAARTRWPRGLFVWTACQELRIAHERLGWLPHACGPPPGCGRGSAPSGRAVRARGPGRDVRARPVRHGQEGARTDLGKVPVRAGSKDGAIFPSGLATVRKPGRNGSEDLLTRSEVSVRCPASLTFVHTPPRSRPHGVAAAACSVNRSQADQRAAWQGPSKGVFPFGRKAKGAGAVGPDGSVRAKTIYFQ